MVVLELADGGTLITSAARLRESLAAASPTGSTPTAASFEKLRAEGAAAQRGFGDAVGGLVSKVFTLVAGETKDEIIDAALDWLKQRGLKPADLGISWAGTQALMWAIESRLMKEPGAVPLGRRQRQGHRSGSGPAGQDLDAAAADRAADAGVPARHRVQHAGQLRRVARRRS